MPTIPIENIQGIDNQSPPFNVPINTPFAATNFDIDDRGRGKTRDGYLLKVAGDFHSIWSNSRNTATYLVDGSTIKRVVKTGAVFSLVTVVTGLVGTGKMSYVEVVRESVVYSNGTDIGRMVNSQAVPFVVSSDPRKTTPVPSHILSWLNARLYMANFDIVWFTDAYTFDVDTKDGLFLFSSKVNMMAAVDDGIFVSDQKSTYFVKNDPPSKVLVEDYPCIENCFKVINSEILGLADFPTGLAVIWASEEGINVGGSGGSVLNLTRNHYDMPEALVGKGVIRNDNGSYKFIVNLFS